jgi:hypothetical protein
MDDLQGLQGLAVLGLAAGGLENGLDELAALAVEAFSEVSTCSRKPEHIILWSEETAVWAGSD